MKLIAIGMIALSALATNVRADIPADKAQALYDQVTPSIVAVQYTYDGELGRVELVAEGVVVSDAGLIMVPLALIPPSLPDAQAVEFKIIVPHIDKADEELDATFEGRDERNELAFVKAKAKEGEKRTWQPVKFEESPIKIGEDVISVGMLPKTAGYRSYLIESTVSAKLRGEIPGILVTGSGLAQVGSPVFNAEGKAIGYVNAQAGKQTILHTSAGGGRRGGEDQQNPLAPIENPPFFFVATSEISQSLQDPPKDGKSIAMPWIGAPQLSGVKDDVADMFGIKDQPAVEIGDIIPGSPADKAGLKVGMKIVKFNGKALPRGDEPDEIPVILGRMLLRLKPGSEVTFSVLEKLNEPMKEIKATLGDRPKTANLAARYYAEDLGYSVREIVFQDTYIRKQPQDLKGVVVALVKPSSSAQTGKLQNGDVITQFNNAAVTDLEAFKKDYQDFRKAKPKEAIVLVVMKRDASTQTIRIEPPQE